MAKFAISMYCYRTERPGNPGGYIPYSQTIVHNPGIVEASSYNEAAGIGLEIIRKLFPMKDGWQNHDVKTCDIDNVLTVDNVRLRDN